MTSEFLHLSDEDINKRIKAHPSWNAYILAFPDPFEQGTARDEAFSDTVEIAMNGKVKRRPGVIATARSWLRGRGGPPDAAVQTLAFWGAKL